MEDKEDGGWDVASAVESKDAVGVNAPGNERVAKLPSRREGGGKAKAVTVQEGGSPDTLQKIKLWSIA